MSRLVIYRFLVDIIILIAIVHGWWFAALPLSFIFALIFPFYAECILFGLSYDALFGTAPILEAWAYAGTISFGALFLATLFIKKIVRR